MLAIDIDMASRVMGYFNLSDSQWDLMEPLEKAVLIDEYCDLVIIEDDL